MPLYLPYPYESDCTKNELNWQEKLLSFADLAVDSLPLSKVLASGFDLQNGESDVQN
jgi:hypothetical protein